MVDAKAYPDYSAPETRLYVQAERLVDSLLDELRWETVKAELDELIAADIDADPPVAMHYGIGR
jgi:hypothetical protein